MSQQFASGEFRIHFPLDPEDDQGLDFEALGAERLGPLPNGSQAFRLTNSPMFAFDISAGDIVTAEKVGDAFEFRSVESHGGHSTYRVFLRDRRAFQDDDVQQAWLPIAALGAGYERANGFFFVIDVPPTANIAAIYDLLEAGEAADLWEFEEGHYGGAGPSNQV